MKSKKIGVNAKLTKAVSDMLDEVMKPRKDGKDDYTLTDKMKVVDRFTKLEMIRLKIEPDGEGDFFRGKRDEDDD